jgi:uncharacterized protein (DUF1800 family)
MTARGKEAAALALHRFGFGPARDSIVAIAHDPRGALLADLDRPPPAAERPNLPSSGEAARAVFDFRAEQQAKQKLRSARRRKPKQTVRPGYLRCRKRHWPRRPAQSRPNQPPQLPQQLIQDEAKARFDAAIGAEIGFVERLVWFWSNHFCISADKDVAMAGAYEREAIRPHVLGRFADMLQAVEGHPAMLFYLDNVESMGADSIAGINRDKGLNENLAREILELHTLGVRSGYYAGADVISFAKVLTGWTWVAPTRARARRRISVHKRLHEPGRSDVLGKPIPTPASSRAAPCWPISRAIRRPRSTSRKSSRATSSPTSRRRAGRQTGQDASTRPTAISRRSPKRWSPRRMSRGRRSADQAQAAVVNGSSPSARLTGAVDAGVNPCHRPGCARTALGEPLWRPPAPNGFPDGSGLDRRRAASARHRQRLAGRIAGGIDPLALLDSGLGPLASADTRRDVARAESRAQALALLVMAPEFLRR